MQNIKNFSLYEPAADVLEKFKINGASGTPLFLKSEDGQDWYECQSAFSDDTVKILYDKDGVITSVVASPVPERGNTLSVSLFFPVNASVAEVSELPEGFELDNTWTFNGEEVTRSPALVAKKVMSGNRSALINRVRAAMVELFFIENSANNGSSTDEDLNNLSELRNYIDALRAMDLTQEDFQLPDAPAFLTLI